MSQRYSIDFGPDKSQIVRSFAIIFMITLHQDTLAEFKICVPMFTFLVGYGYAFAKNKNLSHGLKRIWHLLSHFWLILLVVFLPVAIWKGGYTPTLSNVLENMFGLESNLNWYSWYIYFYIFAMLIMIPASRIIIRYKLFGVLIMLTISALGTLGFHNYPNWSENIWTQAAFDCFLVSPCLYSGFYLADRKLVAKITIPFNILTVIIMLAIMVAIFFLRGLPLMFYLDCILVPIFVFALVSVFNILKSSLLHKFFIAIGKQSMNMWFIHALFATTCTATIFYPLVGWITCKLLLICVICIISYYWSIITNKVYNCLSQGD